MSSSVLRSYELWDDDAPIMVEDCSVTIRGCEVVVEDIGQVSWWDARFRGYVEHENRGYGLDLHPALQAAIRKLIAEEIERLGADEFCEIVAALEKEGDERAADTADHDYENHRKKEAS